MKKNLKTKKAEFSSCLFMVIVVKLLPFRPKKDILFVLVFSVDGFLLAQFNPGWHSYVVLPRAIDILPFQGKKTNFPIQGKWSSDSLSVFL
jgi:hypothetical protein